jgi:DNA invertase Pin-like site-specific DNA recombinase
LTSLRELAKARAVWMKESGGVSKTYAYLRVSGDSQAAEDKNGVQRQEDACNRLAGLLGRTVDRFYRDLGVSGTLHWADRPAFREMRAQMQAGDVLLCEDLDRIGRDLMQIMIVMTDMEQIGVTVYTANQNELKSDPTSKFMRHVIGATAEYVKMVVVQRLNVAKAAAKAKGKRVDGRKRYGSYAHEQAGLRMILDMSERGSTLQEICDALYAAGIRPRGSAKSQPARWALSSIRKVRDREKLERVPLAHSNSPCSAS